MAKYFGNEKAKAQPKGEKGANVQSGLSEHMEFTADSRSAGSKQEQARSPRTVKKVPNMSEYYFDGNDTD